MFILVEVVEREISVWKFDNLADAQAKMKKRFDAYDGSEYADNGDADIGATSAWVNSNFNGGTNCDWSIEEL